MKTFGELFRKYRLKAEFETFAEFGEALEKKGYYYEDSIFSRWQKGNRVPTNRQLIIKILEIFIERDAIKSLEEANQFFESAKLGFLTEKEIANLPQLSNHTSLFQVPNEISDFIAREAVIKEVLTDIANGKTILLYGQAGVGKTTLAIKIAHLLREKFSDGVLWYRLDTTNINDIFISIIHLFGEDLPKSNNREIIASFIRSLLAKKKILLIFDNVEKNSNIHLLFPPPSPSAIIVLSRERTLYLPAKTTNIFLECFSDKEVITLFKNIFNKQYVDKYNKLLLRLSGYVGNLPLAIHLLANQLKQSEENPKVFSEMIKKENISLHDFWYENKNLYRAMNISYKNLSQKARAVFLSLGVFEGKDFSIDAIAYINGLSPEKVKVFLQELYNASFIETSIKDKFRMHPMIKKFIAEKLNNPYLYLLSKISLLAFIIFTLYWIIYQITLGHDDFFRHMFSATYFIVALWGAIWGVQVSNKWGGIKSVMGKAVLFFSLGLFCQVFGQVAYSYYTIVLKIAIPYPSVGDIGFFGSIPIYIYATTLLIKASGERLLSLMNRYRLLSFFYIVALIIIFFLLLQIYIVNWSDPIKIFLDFAAPLGDATYTFFALLLYLRLQKAKKNIMKNKALFFFIALFAQGLADYVFIYQANLGIWSFGQVNDYMYFLAYLFMTLAILRLNSHLSKLINI